jgi:hypothetical protein
VQTRQRGRSDNPKDSCKFSALVEDSSRRPASRLTKRLAGSTSRRVRIAHPADNNARHQPRWSSVCTGNGELPRIDLLQCPPSVAPAVLSLGRVTCITSFDVRIRHSSCLAAAGGPFLQHSP